MGSTRLPCKVMLDLAGEPMLVRVANRAGRAELPGDVVIATTDNPDDDAIAALCDEHDIPCCRGSEDDVLDRYYRAARQHNADAVVRITSDCPLIDPALVDEVVKLLLDSDELDYASNVFPHRRYPRGLDTEVIRFDVLEKLWKETSDRVHREHVTAFIHHNPEDFGIACAACRQDYSHLRWTVDTQEDLKFVRHVYEHFGHDSFTWREVLALLELHPDWLEINRNIEQKEL